MEIDLIYAENLKAGYIAYQFFLRYKIPYILDYHGVVPEEFKEFNLKHKAIEKEYRYLKKMEKTTIENAKKIICVSHYFKNYLCMNFDLKSENIIVVPSCIDQQKIAFSNSMRFKYRERLKLTDENVFIYNGSFTPYQCIEKMILFFSILLKFEKKIFFIFLVTSNLKDVEDLFKKYHVQNDKYTIKSVNHFEVVNYQMAADFGLIIRDDSLVNRVASPTKIFEYLSTGLKLISTDNIGDIDILNIEKYVLSTNDINEDYIMENYINILKKYDRNDNFNKCKIELMEKYIWDSYINDYENIFKN
jgi:glycosyltransferase involved in cell wall biosynthesis